MSSLVAMAFLAFSLPRGDADMPPAKSDRVEVIRFLRDHVLGRTFVSPTTNSKIAGGKIEAQYSSRVRYANLRETRTGFSFETISNVKQVNYPLDNDGERVGLGKDVSRQHTMKYLFSESLSTGEMLGVSLLPERTIGGDVFPAVVSAVKLEWKGGKLLMSSSDVWYHDEFAGGQEKAWSPGIAEVVERLELVTGEPELRIKVRLYEYDSRAREKKLSSDVSETVLKCNRQP